MLFSRNTNGGYSIIDLLPLIGPEVWDVESTSYRRNSHFHQFHQFFLCSKYFCDNGEAELCPLSFEFYFEIVLICWGGVGGISFCLFLF